MILTYDYIHRKENVTAWIHSPMELLHCPTGNVDLIAQVTNLKHAEERGPFLCLIIDTRPEVILKINYKYNGGFSV